MFETIPPPFIGEIRIIASDIVPDGFLSCDGQELQMSAYEDLFSVIGNRFGGDGQTSFRLPDLRGRAAVHAGRGDRLTDRKLADTFGVRAHALSAAEMPAHTHRIPASSSAADQQAITDGSVLATTADGDDGLALYRAASGDKDMGERAMSQAGAGKPHSNMQPYLALRFVIAFAGVSPH